MDFSNLDIAEYLKSKGIKPSYQRIKVFEYLIKYRSHPTVDEIYKELVGEIPTLSKTTIYNILDLFIENGVAQPILIEENETRYDADISVHGHFKCEKCGRIYDFLVDVSAIKAEGIEGFAVNQKHIYYKGICKNCLKE